MRRALLSGVALSSLVAAALPAVAQDIPVATTIEAVTVYPQGALVTRHVPFSLPAGAATLLVPDLPVGIDSSSIRIEGVTGGGLEIRSVETRQADAEPDSDPERVALLDQIQTVEDQLAVLDDRSRAAEGQRSFIDNLIAEVPTGFAELLAAGNGVASWQSGIQAIGVALAEVNETLRQIELQRRDLAEELADLHEALDALPAPRPHLEVRIEVGAAAAAEGVLSLAYAVGAASWQPAYDAFLNTGDDGGEPGVELVRKAEVQQATGEDWSEVAMVLSTARPSGGVKAPELGGTLVSFQQTYPYAPSAAPMPRDAVAAQEMAGGLAGRFDFDEAKADFGNFRADYIIEGPVTITTDTGERSLRIASEAADAHVSIVSTPRVSAEAYLQASFTLESAAAVLAGNVSLFRDGAYVGSDSIAFTNPGEEIDLGFGADDQVKVTLTEISRQTGTQGFLSSTGTDERRYQIEVVNNHGIPVEITIYDRMPYSENEQIVVRRLPSATAPTEENVEDRRGVLAWTYEYAAGETRTINNDFVVSWPSNQNVYWAE
ncbi:MAG: mucoidy inhibitor MuiA family protein [Bauldia sp.]|nr:mucoidy inhibitor MuiA family protein [Bauldia sp.]